jgi:glycosyltransferase involved in cell wall biosynthesis
MRLNQPDITVIIPCYNGARRLHSAIQSALAQTIPPREVLVVDDGSTDNSVDVAESFGPPVRVISQINAGAGMARAHGVAAARSEFVCFQDADDTSVPEQLELLVRALKQHPECVAAFGITRNASNGKCGVLDKLGPDVDGSADRVVNSLQQMLRDGTPLAGAMNLMTRRSVVDEICRIRPFCRAANDYDLQLRLATRGDFVFVRAVTCNYTNSTDGISSRSRHGLQPMLAVCAAFDAISTSASVDAETLNAMKGRLRRSWAYFLPTLILQRHWNVALRLIKLAIRERVVGIPLRNFYWGIRHAVSAVNIGQETAAHVDTVS